MFQRTSMTCTAVTRALCGRPSAMAYSMTSGSMAVPASGTRMFVSFTLDREV